MATKNATRNRPMVHVELTQEDLDYLAGLNRAWEHFDWGEEAVLISEANEAMRAMEVDEVYGDVDEGGEDPSS